MSQIASYEVFHEKCPWCNSSDGYCEFITTDNEYVKFCFACRKRELEKMKEEIQTVSQRVFKSKDTLYKTDRIESHWRSISPETLDKFGVRKLTEADGKGIVFPYYKYGSQEPVSQKVKKKDAQGNNSYEYILYDKSIGLFGSHVFPRGGRSITVTEGEGDALAVYEMAGNYPVVSIKNGAGSVKNISKEDFEYLDSFDTIHICFDMDEVGRKAAADFCAIFPSKAKIIELPTKDAHELLESGRKEEFKRYYWNAKQYSPSSVVYPSNIKDSVLDPPRQEVVPYPWEGLNKQIFGLHFPEVVVIKAPPKIGKSLISAALVHHIWKTTDHKIADITVENTPEERARTLLSLYMQKPLHLSLVDENHRISKDDVSRSFDEFFSDNRIVLFEKDGNSDPEKLLKLIDYFVEVLGCRFVVLDHINYLASYHDTDERKSLDRISNMLVDKAKDKRVCLIIISHINDEGKTFGSRNLEKAGYTIISLDRDKTNSDPFIRNLTTVKVAESRRYGSRIGNPVFLSYDEATYSLTEYDGSVELNVGGEDI